MCIRDRHYSRPGDAIAGVASSRAQRRSPALEAILRLGVERAHALATGRGGDAAVAARELSHRLTVEGAYDNSSGPLYPLFKADITVVNPAAVFAPQRQVMADTSLPVPAPNISSSCNVPAARTCPPAFNGCLLRDPSDAGVVCGCYRDAGSCYRHAGCYEVYPRSTIRHCFDVVRCTMDDCEGMPRASETLV